MRASIAVAGMAALMMALGTYFLLQESQAGNRTAWPDSANRGERAPTYGGPMSNRSLAQTLALLFGVAFLAAGVLGFIPGITQDLGDIKFAGKDSPAELLGIFKVSILHNIVHLLFGVAGVALSRTTANAKMYLLYSGVIYIVLTAFGLFVDSGDDANFIPVNSADTVLHLVPLLGLLGGWYFSKDSDEIVTERPAMPPPAP